MTLPTGALLIAVGAYLLGGIPFGLLIGRARGVDVRSAGSGNIGAANVARLVGRRWGALAFFLDMAKGALPACVAGAVLPSLKIHEPQWVLSACWLASSFCSVLGHNYPLFLGFRGGKGVATSPGVALGIYPQLTIPGLAALAIWGLGIGLTRMSSVGSLSGGLAFPIVYTGLLWLRGSDFQGNWPFLVFSVLISLLLVVRHKRNIARLLRGTESRFGRNPAPGNRTAR